MADLEKAGTPLDPERAADALEAYAKAGFDTFDMADHYGSAELITGRLLARYGKEAKRPIAFTKWCPEPGPMTAEIVRKGVQERLDRLGVDRIDLLQFHWWTFEHPAWLDALHEMARLKEEGLIGAIGVTNFDAAHLALALADGVPVATNQVSFSLVDRRAAGPLSALCRDKGVKLLAYGTLCGGFLSDKWLGRPEPTDIADWSRSKYKRFIDAAGGWEVFQGILAAAGMIAEKHGVSISNVATRWVLEHEAVAAAIIGARITESEHRADNLKIFGFALDAEDKALLEAAFAAATPIPGDCGDEYRRPPYLTASGDLSHHLTRSRRSTRLSRCPAGRTACASPRAASGSRSPATAAPSGSRTRSAFPAPRPRMPRTAAWRRAIPARRPPTSSTRSPRRSPRSAARSRTSCAPASICATPPNGSRCRAPMAGSLATIMPANTMVEAGDLIGDYEVEIEAEAVVGD